jgi:RHH-type transcriptional regulator, proline utilization regulon repressor / proline dehydrogenase / delta 1-pyrroline-5-carboxylate dehydrogenase
VLQLARWTQRTLPAADDDFSPEVAELLSRCLAEAAGDSAAPLRAAAADYTRAWRTHFGIGHDPSGVLGEDNVFRYRPCRGVAVRVDPAEPGDHLALFQVLIATTLCGTPVSLSLPGPAAWPWLQELPGVAIVEESSAAFVERLHRGAGVERLRVWRAPDRAVREAANDASVAVIDAPVLATGRLELRWYLREQAISRVRHRYGNIMSRAAG